MTIDVGSMVGSVWRCARSRSVAGVLPAVLAIAAGSLLASCAVPPKSQSLSASAGAAGTEYFSEKDYGVSASPRVVASSEAVPKGGGRYQVGNPYKVKGKTYRPKEDPDYSKVGLASWYGRAFHGRKTANGEVYDMGELTAAHPTLPLPSYARVTNVANNRSVVVRINDRGPFKKGRIIDVSATAAELLDFKRAGTAKVKVEYVGRARMDGHDRQMLLSSYQGPNDLGGNTLFASTTTAKPKNIILASLSPLRRRNKEGGEQPDRSMDLFGAQRVDASPVTAPAFMPTTFSKDDPLGPLIMRAGFVSSYAPTDRFSRAQLAATELARGGRTNTVVQIGTFSDRSNAGRVAARFGQYGKVVTDTTTGSGGSLLIVRVFVDSGLAPETVLSAARGIGIADAFVVSR